MSVQSGNILSLTNGAGALTRGRFVKLVAGLVVTTAAITDEDVIGVTTDDVLAGEVAGIAMINGSQILEVESGAAIAIGAQVAGNATGQAITATTAGNVPAGIALQAASGAGEFISVLLTRQGGLAT